MGIWSACGSVGMIIGKLVSTTSLVHWGWPGAFFSSGFSACVVAMIIAPCLLEHPRELNLPSSHGSAAAQEEDLTCQDSKRVPIWSILALPSLGLNAVATFFTKLLFYAFANWLPYYLEEARGFSQEDAGYIATMFDWGGFFGCLVGGYMCDILGSCALTSVIFQILSCPIMWFFFCAATDVSRSMTMLSLALLGACITTPYNLITTVASVNLGRHDLLKGSTQATSTVTGIIDGSGSFGAAIQGPLVGAIVGLWGWKPMFQVLMLTSMVAATIMFLPAYSDISEHMYSRRRNNCDGNPHHHRLKRPLL